MQLTPVQEAARELLIRRRARENVLDYAEAIEIPGKPVTDDPDAEFFTPIESRMAQHHRLILEKLDRVSRTPNGRMMIFMPPGSAKSTYASVVFPAQFLGRKAGNKIILASYASELAEKMGRRTRQILKQPRYKQIFGTELSPDRSAVHNFTLLSGSEYMSGGLLSGITGNRAHGLIVDDPVKGRAEAESKVEREKTWNAFIDDAMTRLMPGGWVCIIQTRWHEDDLSGRLLPDGWAGESGLIRCKDGKDWEVLCIQARCEVDGDPLGRKHGEYLWPQWFTREHWSQFEAQPRTWNSLFQQRPTTPDGDLFKPAKIQVIDAVPAGTRFVRGWDLGATEDRSGDPTVGALLGKTPDGRFVIADIQRDWLGPHERDHLIRSMTSQDGMAVKQSLPQDPGQAGKTQVKYLAGQLAGYPVHTSTESGDKVTRADPFAGQVNAGNVCMVRAAWNAELLEELRGFPAAKHDDQVDALSRAFAVLAVGPKPAQRVQVPFMAR
jgi:predicted phage terminase large subunit-like protein